MPRNEFVHYEDAVKYVRKLKADFGNGVSTLGLIHNATEEPLTFVTSHDWWGHIYNQQAYPQVIGAGHWGGFLHVKTAGPPSGSQGAVVYRGKRKDGKAADWLVAWDNPWQRVTSDNKTGGQLNRKCGCSSAPCGVGRMRCRREHRK
ncbi:hypothetical protein PTKIN_Ptkin09bG0262000 [Pterospermum kingtungense]